MTKSEFIRQQPPEMHAKDVVFAAQEAGIQISLAHVHVVRSKARRDGVGDRPLRKSTKRKPAAEVLDWTESTTGLEGDLVAVAMELGFTRSSQLLDEFRNEIRGRRG